MKTTLRRIIATSLSAAALSFGLGVVAAPAQAAENCTSISSIRGSAVGRTYTDPEGFRQDEVTFTDVSLRTPGACSSSSWRYVLTTSYSGDSDFTRSNSHYWNRYSTSTTVGFPALTIGTPPGSGRMTLTVQPQRYSSTYGFWFNTTETTDFYVYVPGSFDSSTGSGMASGGSCINNGPVVGYSTWC